MKKFVFAVLFITTLSLNAQEKKEESKFGIIFSGFVKTDIFYDTRQNVSIREGHFLLYPDNISADANGVDINAEPNFNILSIQSRLKGSIFGPDAFGAKTSGVLEADFFGNENASFSDLNGFRMRHAFVKLNWTSAELLVGQYWHPMFIAESFPGVISFNTGAPFQPFSRNPQIRFVKTVGGLKFIGSAFSQRDFTGIGPEYTLANGKYTSASVASSKYLRNSGIPNLHFQAQYKSDSLNLLVGAGLDYKVITPELYTVNHAATSKYASEETLASFSAMGFVNLNLDPLSIKLQGIYAQNAYDMVMIGGYGIHEISDTATGSKEFTNLNTLSVWADFQTKGKKVQVGLFGGYTKNLGSNDSIQGTIYARGSNIDYVYRIAPRIVFISGKLSIAVETEYTVALYGTANGDGKGGVSNTTQVSGLRSLLAVIYSF